MVSLDGALDTVLSTGSGSPTNHKRVKISSQSKINSVVSDALLHFYQPTPTPILFHSLHLPTLSPTTPSLDQIQTSTPALTTIPPPPPDPLPTPPNQKKEKGKKVSSSAIPKLISISEIIKRSFVPAVEDTKGKGKEKRKEKVKGLYQYNYLGTYEELDLVSEEGKEVDPAREEERMGRITREWLEGRAGKNKRPRMSHTPFLLVLLSIAPLPSTPKGFTYQRPSPSTVTRKSTKELAPATADVTNRPPQQKKKRRKRKAGTTTAEDVEDDEMDVSVEEANADS